MLKVLKCWNSISLSNIRRNYTKKKTAEMKYLNVAEKHDAAKTIAGLLSNGAANRREGYSVYNKVFDFETVVRGCQSKMVMTSVSGHLLNLEFLVSYRNWRCVDPKSLFDAPVRRACSEDYAPIKRTLEREIRGCQGLIIWTDCDREGENIGFEIIEVCRAIKPNINVYRATFSEITTAAVRRALQQLGQPDKRKNDAVNVRTELDLRTGAAITRYQTMRLQRLFPDKICDKLISYGSCQIPTLGFVVERYKEVEAFVSEPFWKIKVTHTIDDLTVEFNWSRNRLFDKEMCENYFLLCLSDPKATVENVSVKPKSKWRPTPMDTVDLEKLGSRKLKLSAKETMTIAEKLYTKGIISYPRTETNQFSKEIDLRSLVEQQTSHSIWGDFAQRVAEWGPNPRNGNKSDQAHPPIHPTKLMTNLEGNEGRVYELICRHFLACVSKDAVGSETIVNISIAGENFTATGLCIYERNYLDVYIYDKWNAKQIHAYVRGQVFEPTEISMPEGATTAPALLTEADLIALMEKHGIGTDATHAEHINTIKERGYIGVVDNGFLVPGVIGMGLYEGYDAMQLLLAKPVLRAEFEADLKKICLGEKEPQAVLQQYVQKYKDSYQQIIDRVTAMDEKIALRINETLPTSLNDNGSVVGETLSNSTANWENNPSWLQELCPCPKCAVASLALRQKKNRTDYFIGCLNFPDCKNVIWLPTECNEPSVLQDTCERCGPSVKLLKVKFKLASYKSMFNAPLGWYKTCLRCDAKFRDTFNINLDSVKRVGAIVSNTVATTASTVTAAPRSATISSTSSSNSSRETGSAGSSRASQVKRRKSDDTKAPTRAVKKAAILNKNDIRSYYTTSSSATAQRNQVESPQPQTGIEAVQLDDFFGSNDGFDNLILNLQANSVTVSASTTDNNNRNVSIEFSEDIAAAFACDDDTFGFAESGGWGSTVAERALERAAPSRNPTCSSSHTSNSVLPANRRLNDVANAFDDSFGTACADFDLENFAWGTTEHNKSRATNEPETQRVHLSNNHERDLSTWNEDDTELNRSTTEFNWGSAANAPRQTSAVNCSGCHQPAKECIVKKDGPNKGKLFYCCPKNNQCKFFEWADNSTNDQHISSETPTSSARYTSSSTVRVTLSNELVNCNCGVMASSLTVRKEGPNKGRPFYGCVNRSCGFFKWGDENENQAFTSMEGRDQNHSWGSGRGSAQGTTTANRNSTTSSHGQRDNKKRKCGLCRQEGHNRANCPRKAEFEF